MTTELTEVDLARPRPREVSRGHVCHAARSQTDTTRAFCGAIVSERPCCNPAKGHPSCNRPRCPECETARGEW